MSLPLLHAGRTNPGLSAALDLRFALDKSLTAYRGPTPSFSRASTGSYFDGSGVLRYATVNLFTYSDDFSDGSWTKANSATIIVNNAIAPNGTLTADRITAASNISSVYKTMTVESGRTYSFSVFAKAGNFSKIVMEHRQSGINADAVFDLSNGTLVSGSGVITDFGNGWYRCSISEATVDTSDLFIIGFESTATNGSYVYLWGAQLEASSTVGTYCPTTSSANSAPRFNHTYNGTSWVSRGLLVEEQRTNDSRWSENFSDAVWTKTDGGASVSLGSSLSPSGILTANSVIETSITGRHGWYTFVNKTSGNYTGSIFVKKLGAGSKRFVTIDISFDSLNGVYATFDPELGLLTQSLARGSSSIISTRVENVGNGWFRISLSITGAATYLTLSLSTSGVFTPINYGYESYTGDSVSGILAWGAQFESGAFPTSYIGTTNSSVVRSADVCQITGGDFSGFWNGTEGSLVAEFDRTANLSSNYSAGYPHLLEVHDGSTNNRFIIYGDYTSSGQEDFGCVNGGSIQFLMQQTAVPANITGRISGAYKLNDSALSVNGAAVSIDTACTIPTVTRMTIGYTENYAGGRPLNGHIARLRYFNKRLPNATLQLLSEPDPTLNLQFALNKTLTPVAGPAPSFSRASTGTYFNASGVLTSASINTPRFDHVYSGGQWVSKGLLVEEQRTNSLSNSEDFTVWAKSGNGQINSNVATAPDGTTTADEIQVNSGAASAYETYRAFTYSSVPYSISIFVKYVNNRWVSFGTNSPYHNKCVFFDILNGVVGTASPFHSGEIINCGNGWFRLIVKFVGNTGTNNFIDLTLADGDGVNSCTTGAKVLVWGAQIEAGSFSTSYIGTTSSAVTRSADVCQITGTSFNWMWNQGEGSVVAEWDARRNSGGQFTVYWARDAASSNTVLHTGREALTPPGVRFTAVSGASVSAEIINAGFPDPGVQTKTAGCYKVNDFAYAYNGNLVGTDTSGAVPVNPADILIGSDPYSNYLNGHIAKLIYYPARLTNTKLQQLST